MEEPAFLDPDGRVRELPLEPDRVVLSSLSERDDVVPRLEDAHVQLRLRLGIGVGHALVDEGLHVEPFAERDRIVDLFQEQPGDRRIEAARCVHQDDLQGLFHDRSEVRVPRALRGVAGSGDEPPRGREVFRLDGLREVDQDLFKIRGVGPETPQVLRVDLETGERVPDRLQEGRLPHRIVGFLRERPDLAIFFRRERRLGFVEDGLRAAYVHALPPLARGFAGGLPQARVGDRMASRLLQAVPGPLREERDVRVHAPSERVPSLGEDLAGLGDVHAVPTGRVDVRRGAVEDRLRARILALGVGFLDRLRRQRSDAMVFPQGERVPGFGEMALRFLDIPAALFRVSHASLGLFDDSLEDSFPSLVERSDGDSTKQAFRGDEVPPAREGPGLVDVSLERERLDAGFLGAVEHRVRICERFRDPRLAPRDFEGPSGGAREVERPSQVARSLGLLGALQQAPGKRRVGHVAARGDEVFASGRDRPFRDVGRRPGRQAAVERLPADVARGTPVRYVRFAEGAAGHVAPTEGSPSTSGGNDTVGCRVCRYK